MGYALDLMDTAHYYAQYRRLMAHWKSLFGGDILDFDYDAFVREPRACGATACSRIAALSGTMRCLAFHEAASTVKTASVWQVREPLYARSSGRARHYERHLETLRASLERGF